MINPASQLQLSGKKVLLIGGSGLLGNAILEALVTADAQIVISSRTPHSEEEMTERFPEMRLGQVHPYPVDLASPESIRNLYDCVEEKLGQIDGLVFNSVSRPIYSQETDSEAWNLSMKINSTGFYLVTAEALNRMAKIGSGSIIGISSIQGMLGSQQELYEGLDMNAVPDYFFHKGGMINYTRYLASIAGRNGVRVNCISPGGIFNDLKPQIPEFVRRYSKATMLGRLAKPEEIVGSVLFLLSDLSTYITGTNLVVDGGYSAK